MSVDVAMIANPSSYALRHPVLVRFLPWALDPGFLGGGSARSAVIAFCSGSPMTNSRKIPPPSSVMHGPMLHLEAVCEVLVLLR